VNGKGTIDGRAKIEYLAQHQLEQLDPDGTPMQTMIDRYPGDSSNSHIMELRRYLANFGLGGEILPGQKIHTMSGGQKCRLCLASAMYRRPHLLILDGKIHKQSLCPGLLSALTFHSNLIRRAHEPFGSRDDGSANRSYPNL
jgi:ABC-type dipeptide/oligopeptide/nickel transport system ATPase subunit